ncbi:hypothetical protein BJ546DRAFT_1039474 [Cryomyces antarcticus]
MISASSTKNHIDWAKAIVMHSNMFYSPVWSVIYPVQRLHRLHRGIEAGTYIVEHQINSGMSFGVFDNEYKYKRPESEATEGRLYWNETAEPDADADNLLSQMDFPLVSQVLMRNATSTRHGYEGEGLMKKLAQFLMREAKLEGYRSIQIECVNDTVTHTWCHPPHPFKGELIAEVDMETYEEEAEDGKRVRVFAPAKQRGTKVFVTL